MELTPQNYRKKPVTIQAHQVTEDNKEDIVRWIIAYGAKAELLESQILIRTPEGDMAAPVGHYVVRGAENEFYALAPYIFERIYLAV